MNIQKQEVEMFLHIIKDNYFLGILIIGLPMALTSAFFYKIENRMDYHKLRWLMVLIRNILHPLSFVHQGPCESQDNFRMTYEGPISGIIGDSYFESKRERVIRFMIYIILSSAFWPIRLFFISLIWFITLGIPVGIIYILYRTGLTIWNF